ncbi:hypothetical protein FM996_15270 [Methylosinus sporium]|uniref:Uncharacterized protein n=1 Tax=Methylosinus sporium TaxID=428 RepID=A0A549SMG9_METSR|nr:hypothetical protein [Methylosinus sporium]TRL30821.1 hypothetical protein FM996_15270 [Methylosinus sporium]
MQKKMDYELGKGLSDSESSILRQRLFASLGVDGHKPGKEIGELFSRKFKEIATSIPMGDDAFLYNAVTDFCGYDPVVVFINFYEFDAINVISLKQLSRVLNDIWLPGAEDIDIFDATFSWVVQVNHEEILLALRAE